MNLPHRPRRLRQNSVFCRVFSENQILPQKLILPLFVTEGKDVEVSNPHLPSCKTFSRDRLLKFLPEVVEHGISSILLFGVSKKKDARGTEALNKNSALIQSISDVREKFPQLLIATDIALDPYTDHGHDGLFENNTILNDETVEVLCEMALLHAKAGAHIVAPSDMMDGRVGAIRACLDESSFQNTAILSYTAKYASAFYGPFRETLSASVQGDKKTYQMNPANRREALKELELDFHEAADIVMVKPASHYLDIISDFRDSTHIPVAAYHVSGECALLELGAKQGLFDRDRALMEVLTSIFRAGADLIATYFALEAARLSSKN